jgi:valine dehydrogenase (NAD+)
VSDCSSDAGVLYAPDYVINAGGLIQVASELQSDTYDAARARAAVEQIGPRLRDVLDLAREERIATARAADMIAERRIAAIGRLRGFWLRTP